MLDTILKVCKAAAYIAIAAAFGCGTFVIIKIQSDIRHSSQQISQTAEQAYKVVLQSRYAIDNLNKAAIDERLYFEQELPGTMNRVNTILDSTNKTMLSLQQASTHIDGSSVAVLTQAQATMVTLDRTIAQTNTHLSSVMTNAAVVEANVNQLVTAPEIKSTLVNVDQSTAHIAAATDNANGILADGRKVADKYVAPEKWYMKALNYMFKGGVLAYDFIR